jgi:hypothetical protein
MNTEVTKLHNALGQIDLAWTEDDINAQTARPALNAASTTLSSGTGNVVENKTIVDESEQAAK